MVPLTRSKSCPAGWQPAPREAQKEVAPQEASGAWVQMAEADEQPESFRRPLDRHVQAAGVQRQRCDVERPRPSKECHSQPAWKQHLLPRQRKPESACKQQASPWHRPSQSACKQQAASQCQGWAEKQGRGGRGVARGLAVEAARPLDKRQCHFMIGIVEEPRFGVFRRVTGYRGEHMKRIASATQARLRLRGAGSGFAEGPEQKESTDPLMLCVSAPNAEGYSEAVRLVTEHLEAVYDEYRQFCFRNRLPAPDVAVSRHEGPREGARAAGYRGYLAYRA